MLDPATAEIISSEALLGMPRALARLPLFCCRCPSEDLAFLGSDSGQHRILKKRLGAAYCTPEIDTSELIVDVQLRFPTGFHFSGGVFQRIVTFIVLSKDELFTLLDLCVSSLRRGHANLLCIVPSLTDDPRRESSKG